MPHARGRAQATPRDRLVFLGCQGRGAPSADPAAGTHRVGLLCAGCYVPLGVLVSLDQQLDQAGDDGGLLERGMVGRAQGQVADQADGSLQERGGGRSDVSTVDQNSACAPRDPPAGPPSPCPAHPIPLHGTG